MVSTATAQAAKHQPLVHTQPHSTEAERTVLGALLLDPDAMVRIASTLSSDHFYDPVYQAIYRAAETLFQQGSVIDFVTVGEALKTNQQVQELGGTAFLADISSEVPTASHIENYAKTVKEKWAKRALIKAGEQIRDLGHDTDRHPAALIEQMEQIAVKLSGITSSSVTKKRMDVLVQERYDDYTAAHQNPDKKHNIGLKTGFVGLDRVLMGLEPENFVVAAGRPSMGKTAFALNIIKNVAVFQDKAVLFFSLEQSENQIVDRLAAMLAQVPVENLKEGTLTPQEFETLSAQLEKLAEANIHIVSDTDTSLTGLCSQARRHALQQHIDLVVIDYLQLITSTERWALENHVRWITRVSGALKQLARDLEVPVLTLSQLSRKCEDRPLGKKQPILADLRDSGSIEQDADIVMMLYRDEYYDEQTDRPCLTDVFVRKNRDGATGEVELQWQSETLTFSDPE